MPRRSSPGIRPFAALGEWRRRLPEDCATLRSRPSTRWCGWRSSGGRPSVIFRRDIYDSADRGVRAQYAFLRGVERLGEQGITVFVAHGNHDPMDGWSAVRRMPENLVVFGADAVKMHTIGLGDEPWAYVYGISYPRRVVTENLALRF